MITNKEIVEKILSNDPKLEHPEHRRIREFYLKFYRNKNKWGKIS